ncbi:MAG: TonB family protein [Opitutaceae bacterium]|nr:TonB family protein [Opitutaceae bacterium]
MPIEIPAELAGELAPDFVGSVTLRIDTDGAVKRVTIESPRPPRAIGRLVETALGSWRFEPPTRNGRAASVLVHAVYSRAPSAREGEPQFLLMALPAYPSPLLRPAGSASVSDPDQMQKLPNTVQTAAPQMRSNKSTGQSTIVTADARADPRGMMSLMSQTIVPTPWFSGYVMVRSTIDTDGTVTRVEILRSTASVFEPAAAAAAAACRFTPALQDGKPVQTTLVIPVPVPGVLQNPPPLFFQRDQTDPTATAWDEPPRMQHVAFPIYPIELLKKRVAGRATARVELDVMGKVVRTELLEASHPEFGHALLASITRCVHDPARRDGKRVSCSLIRTAVFDPNLDSKPPVESETPAIALPYVGDRRPVPAASLDTPLHTIAGRPPQFAHAQADSGHAESATVSFIVDCNGTVREPRIVRASSDAAGYAAVQSVSSWLYANPIQGGVPVPAHTEVTFPAASTPQS